MYDHIMWWIANGWPLNLVEFSQTVCVRHSQSVSNTFLLLFTSIFRLTCMISVQICHWDLG